MPISFGTFKPFIFFVLATAYTGIVKITLDRISVSNTEFPLVAHTIVMIYQLIALNVAVNSFDHALLTLLVSNQFVEIKGSVFKRFEKESLFQITCAGGYHFLCMTLLY
jgi:hypothetical protein